MNQSINQKQVFKLELQNPRDKIWLDGTLLIIKLIVGFFRSMLYGFLVVEIAAVILMLVIETPLENIPGFLFLVTPRIGEIHGEVVHYGKEDVVYFFVFWGIVLWPIKYGFEKLLKIKLEPSFKIGVVLLTALHVIAGVSMGIRWGWNLVPPIVLFYLLVLGVWWGYLRLGHNLIKLGHG